MITVLNIVTENGWLNIWKIVLLLVLMIFSGMAVIVSVGAVRDLFSMFRDLTNIQDQSGSDE